MLLLIRHFLFLIMLAITLSNILSSAFALQIHQREQVKKKVINMTHTIGKGEPVILPNVSPAHVQMQSEFSIENSSMLLVKIEIVNKGEKDIYVLNRLWQLDAKSDNKPILEPEKAYRFVHHDILRLLLGAAPIPTMGSTFANLPCATLVKAHSDLKFEFAIHIPVAEYSSYCSPLDQKESVQIRIKRVDLIVQYVTAHDGVTATPSVFLGPSALKVNTMSIPTRFTDKGAEFFHSYVLIRDEELQAFKRTDDFSRLVLPGDPPTQFHPR